MDSPQFAHADRHLFVFHPAYNGSSNQTMFLATDGGLFRTDNARATVSTGPNGTCQNVFTSTASILWADLNHSYVATQYYHGVSYPGGQEYLSGAQDNSVITRQRRRRFERLHVFQHRGRRQCRSRPGGRESPV